jgi:hypothetical protein
MMVCTISDDDGKRREVIRMIAKQQSQLPLQKEFERLAEGKAISADSDALTSSETIKFEREGRTIDAYLCRSSNKRFSLSTTLDRPEPSLKSASEQAQGIGRPVIELRPETWADRLGKTLKINQETHTGDEAFDINVYVDTNASDKTIQMMLSSGDVRKGVLALVEAGFSVRMDSSGPTLEAFVYSPEASHLTSENVDWFVRIAQHWPVFVGDTQPRNRAGTILAVLAITVVLSFVFVLMGGIGGAGRVFPIARYHVIDPLGSWATWGWVALWPVIMAGIVLEVRGASNSLSVISVCAFLVAIALPFPWFSTLYFLNGWWDPITEYEAVVLDKRYTGKSNKLTPRITIVDWRPLEMSRGAVETCSDFGSHRCMELEVKQTLYYSLRPGDVVAVPAGQGRLGWEWVLSHSIRPK